MTKILIPSFCDTIIKKLEENGFKAYLVGGCVRDAVLGKEPCDYDVATDATPSEMKNVFSELRVIETGLKHGTLTVLSDNNPVEVTTFRIDGEYEDNRHPKKVEFTVKLSDDLSRRDFTVNSLAYNQKSGLVDLFGGRSDIELKIIKCVGKPDERFEEDALRILRALRFASVLDFEIDKDTEKSIFKNKLLLKNISAERIFSEFKKLLCGKAAEKILIKYREVISVFLPEIEPCFDFDQRSKYHCFDIYTHIVKTVSNSESDETVRLACFLHDIGKPKAFFTDENGIGHFYGHQNISANISDNVLKRLKADNKILKTVSSLVRYHDCEIEPSEKAVKRFISKTSADFLRELIKIKKADSFARNPDYRKPDEYFDELIKILEKIVTEEQCFKLKDLAVNGNDIAELGFEGKKIGEILNTLLEKVIDGELKNEKEELINSVIEKRR